MNTATTTQLRTLAIAAINLELAAGEDYAGAILNEDGSVQHHVVLLPGETTANHADATTWAAEQGGVLPSQREQSLLYSNLKSKFRPTWYWSSDLHGARFACSQDFGYGDQDFDGKGAELPARAVRRVFP